MKNISQALRYLKNIDPRLKILIDRFGKPDYKPNDNYFEALVKSIVYQQLSGKAAFTIYSRFLDLFNSKDFPLSKQVLKISDQKYRSIGLSRQKSCYIKEIANAFAENEIIPEDIPKMNDEEIRNLLIKIKGIGPWTVDMFLMFTLNRPDIFPVSDLGIQKGFTLFFQLDEIPKIQFMEKQAEKWRPFRTAASWYMWKLVDDDFQW